VKGFKNKYQPVKFEEATELLGIRASHSLTPVTRVSPELEEYWQESRWPEEQQQRFL